MEKLIELLNEYEEKEKLNMYEWEIEGEDILAYSKFRDGYETINVGESIIISKWYEFIKRLVENDKIDFESENYPLKGCYPYYDDVLAIVSQNINTYEDYCKSCYDNYESLLMLLSIQDEPIDFLCKIIK